MFIFAREGFCKCFAKPTNKNKIYTRREAETFNSQMLDYVKKFVFLRCLSHIFFIWMWLMT